MILSSDATYENGQGTGDPTEIALLLLGDDLGIDRKIINAEASRASEFSFDSDRKLMSTLNEEGGKYTVYTKGAIDNLIKISTQVLEKGKVIPITAAHKKMFLDATEKMSNNALRTLGVAYKPVDSIIEGAEMEKDLTLLGLVGMIDPPRAEVKESIQKAKLAGITTIMITGDHKNTAFAIARELGMARSINQAITGEELDTFSDKELFEKIMHYRVFARVSPEHKVKIVHALKAHDNIVSMTGDGVNDAPSLNAADIGVAMGITGTDVAKGASDMILMDDNFATIVSAIEQGRNIYSNIKKAVIFLITCNLGEVIGALTIFAFWFGYYEHGYSPFDRSVPQNTVEYARTMAFMVLVMCQLFFSLAVRNSSKSIFQIGIFSNKYLVGAIALGVILQLIVISIPFMQRAFHLQMLDLEGWLIAISLGLIPLLVNEIVKIFIRARIKSVISY